MSGMRSSPYSPDQLKDITRSKFKMTHANSSKRSKMFVPESQKKLLEANEQMRLAGLTIDTTKMKLQDKHA